MITSNYDILIISENALVDTALNQKTYGYNLVMASIAELKRYMPNCTEDEKNKILASLGSRFLNFKASNDDIIHSQPHTYQAIGGYNNLYDDIFGFGTNMNMDKLKYDFEYNDTEYIFWIWKGDYLNLGAGAEIGFYSRPKQLHNDPQKYDHYFVDYDISQKMNLYLYDSADNNQYDTVFSWEPTAKQWWITGFNPEYVYKVDVNNISSIGYVRIDNKRMYDAMIIKIEAVFENEKQYYIFDDQNHIVWIAWYGGNQV